MPSPTSYSSSVSCSFAVKCPASLILVVIAAFVFVEGQAPPVSSTALLDLDKTLEVKTGPAQKQAFEISADAGQYIKLQFQTTNIRVRCNLIKPDGKALLLYGSLSFDPQFQMAFISSVAGKYRVEISSWRSSPEGTYSIGLIEQRTATDKEKSLQEAKDFVGEGLALNMEGKNVEAIKSLQKGLKIREDLLGPDTAAVAEVLTYLSASYAANGDYTSAIDIRTRSLKIKQKVYGENDPDIAQIDMEIGSLYIQKGDDDAAEPFIEKSIDILTALNKIESVVGANDYGLLGEIAHHQGKLDVANDNFGKDLAITEKLFGTEHFHLTPILDTLSRVALESGDILTAERLLNRSLAITRKTYGNDDWRAVLELNDLGRVYYRAHDLVKSEQMYRQALSLNESRGVASGTMVLESESGLGAVYASQGVPTKALEFQTRASNGEEQFIQMNMVAGSEREKLAFLATLTPLVTDNVSYHIQFAPDNDGFRDLALTTILRRKGRTQDFLAYANENSLARLSPDEQKIFDRLADVTAKLSNLALRGPENLKPAEYQKQLGELEKSREQIGNDINARNLKSLRLPPPVSIDDVRNQIPANAVLVEFAVYRPYDLHIDHYADDGHYAVYVLSKDGVLGWRDLGSVKEIDSEITAFRAALRDPNRSDAKDIGRKLDERVMRPIREITGKADRLLVSPDGELNVIPFEALVGEDGKYLIEKYSFTYLSSGRDLLRIKDERAGSGGNPVIVGNPNFGIPKLDSLVAANPKSYVRSRSRKSVTATRDISDTYFAPLRGSEQEARSIHGLFPDAKYLTGDGATETALKEVSAPRILHIATHGFFLEDPSDRTLSQTRSTAQSGPAGIDDPLLRSGLALAGANRRSAGNDDGLLTALEASGLNLWGTELVVLSACDTGLGEVRNGEGVYGLRRAFGIAGSESIVMSLWPVSDQFTRDMMIKYYKNLKDGMGRGDALRRVQLELIKRADRSHPFYWASFIQSGNWTPISTRK